MQCCTIIFRLPVFKIIVMLMSIDLFLLKSIEHNELRVFIKMDVKQN